MMNQKKAPVGIPNDSIDNGNAVKWRWLLDDSIARQIMHA
jgi:hypothetical protein